MPDLKRAWRTVLSARRAQRTKSRGPKGLQLEVGARRAPGLDFQLKIDSQEYNSRRSWAVCHQSVCSGPSLVPWRRNQVYSSLVLSWSMIRDHHPDIDHELDLNPCPLLQWHPLVGISNPSQPTLSWQDWRESGLTETTIYSGRWVSFFVRHTDCILPLKSLSPPHPLRED